jgi:hypothetical protein
VDPRAGLDNIEKVVGLSIFTLYVLAQDFFSPVVCFPVSPMVLCFSFCIFTGFVQFWLLSSYSGIIFGISILMILYCLYFVDKLFFIT